MSDLSREENSQFLSTQLITCIGNKRALLDFLGKALDTVKARLGKSALNMGDYFSGSGIVSRYFKAHATRLVVNDLEPYAEVLSRCFLSNAREVDLGAVERTLSEIVPHVEANRKGGFISEMYAPLDDNHICAGERVFFTRRNALYLDAACQALEKVSPQVRLALLGPLLSEVSVHTNTSGVFKGFYKNGAGIGCFGGKNGDALKRICGDIHLSSPVLSDFSCPVEVFRMDANVLARQIDGLDLVYLDPPYNQHPYGSNYFMLNLIADYKRPQAVSAVSGIPSGWNRSDYNARGKARDALFALIGACKASHLLISYNSEGFVTQDDFTQTLSAMGKVTIFEVSYNTFRGSRNLNDRPLKVKEYLYLLEK
ncbi:MAG: DNA adenine methylase [Akkermansia sp.]